MNNKRYLRVKWKLASLRQGKFQLEEFFQIVNRILEKKFFWFFEQLATQYK